MLVLLYCLLVCVIPQNDSNITHAIDASNGETANRNSTKLPPIVIQNETANAQSDSGEVSTESHTELNNVYEPSKVATESSSTELNNVYEPSTVASKSPTKSPIESHTEMKDAYEPSKIATQPPSTTPTKSISNSPTKLPSVCPTVAPTTSPTVSPTKAPKAIDWKLSYETKSNIDKFNEEIIHYNVIFGSFECVDTKCKCKDINLKISIESIERELHSLKCEEIFNKFEFNILPGIVYKYEITPTININNQPVITESKTFLIKEEIDSNILSFELELELNSKEYNALQMDANYLSNKLTSEIVRIVEINRNDISVKVQPPKNKQIAIIKIRISRIEQSTKTQIAIEKIRNLYYQPTTSSVISKIIQDNKSIQVIAISFNKNVDSDSANSGYNYGASFFVIIVIGVCCWLTSRYCPTKFGMAVNFCKLMIEKFIIYIQPIMGHIIHYMSQLMSRNANNQGRPHSTKYDVLNISEDIEMGDVEDESGIILLNEIFDEQNIPAFTRERYIRILKDNWLTKIEQLQQLNKDDWKRFDIPSNIQQAIESKLKYDNSQNESFVIGEATSSDHNEHATSSNLDELSYQLSDNAINTSNVVDLIPTNEDLNLSDSFSDF